MGPHAGTVLMRYVAEAFIGLGLLTHILHDLLLPHRAIYRPR